MHSSYAARPLHSLALILPDRQHFDAIGLLNGQACKDGMSVVVAYLGGERQDR